MVKKCRTTKPAMYKKLNCHVIFTFKPYHKPTNMTGK